MWMIYVSDQKGSGLRFYGQAETKRESVQLRQEAGRALVREGRGTAKDVIAYNDCGRVKIGVHLK